MADHFASPTRAAAKEHDNIKLLQAGSPCTALIQLEPTRSLEFVGNETRIAMELCEGGDMGRCGNLKPGSLASSFQIKAVVRPVLRGLRRLEERRCVHGDIKGANIVIGGANLKDDAEVKICDFGSSTFLPPSGSGLHVPNGTPGYMAPEVSFQYPDPKLLVGTKVTIRGLVPDDLDSHRLFEAQRGGKFLRVGAQCFICNCTQARSPSFFETMDLECGDAQRLWSTAAIWQRDPLCHACACVPTLLPLEAPRGSAARDDVALASRVNGAPFGLPMFARKGSVFAHGKCLEKYSFYSALLVPPHDKWIGGHNLLDSRCKRCGCIETSINVDELFRSAYFNESHFAHILTCGPGVKGKGSTCRRPGPDNDDGTLGVFIARYEINAAAWNRVYDAWSAATRDVKQGIVQGNAPGSFFNVAAAASSAALTEAARSGGSGDVSADDAAAASGESLSSKRDLVKKEATEKLRKLLTCHICGVQRIDESNSATEHQIVHDGVVSMPRGKFTGFMLPPNRPRVARCCDGMNSKAGQIVDPLSFGLRTPNAWRGDNGQHFPRGVGVGHSEEEEYYLVQLDDGREGTSSSSSTGHGAQQVVTATQAQQEQDVLTWVRKSNVRSAEQTARGYDTAADIWSFGCFLLGLIADVRDPADDDAVSAKSHCVLEHVMLGFGENESKYVSPRVHVCGQKCGLAHIHCTCGKPRLPRRSGPVDNAPRREEKQSGAASSVRIRRGSLGARASEAKRLEAELNSERCQLCAAFRDAWIARVDGALDAARGASATTAEQAHVPPSSTSGTTASSSVEVLSSASTVAPVSRLLYDFSDAERLRLKHFIDSCLRIRPDARGNASSLSKHPFLNVSNDKLEKYSELFLNAEVFRSDKANATSTGSELGEKTMKKKKVKAQKLWRKKLDDEKIARLEKWMLWRIIERRKQYKDRLDRRGVGSGAASRRGGDRTTSSVSTSSRGRRSGRGGRGGGRSSAGAGSLFMGDHPPHNHWLEEDPAAPAPGGEGGMEIDHTFDGSASGSRGLSVAAHPVAVKPQSSGPLRPRLSTISSSSFEKRGDGRDSDVTVREEEEDDDSHLSGRDSLSSAGGRDSSAFGIDDFGERSSVSGVAPLPPTPPPAAGGGAGAAPAGGAAGAAGRGRAQAPTDRLERDGVRLLGEGTSSKTWKVRGGARGAFALKCVAPLGPSAATGGAERLGRPLSERNICGDLLGDVLTSRTSIFWNDDDDEDDDDDDDDEEEDGSRRNVEMDAIRKTLERERKCAQLHHGR